MQVPRFYRDSATLTIEWRSDVPLDPRRRRRQAPSVPTVDARVTRLYDIDAWRALCPGLGVEDSIPPVAPAIDHEHARQWANELADDGYTRMYDVLPRHAVLPLRAAIDAVRALGLPPVFVFVYDQPWLLPARFEPLLERTLLPGYKLLGRFWAWHLDPRTADAGWRPHRDRDVDTIDTDGRPRALTLWFALTDATPDNGCMYVLPASRDPMYRQRFTGATDYYDPQNVRALPATAGTVLCWDHAILHWGGRANPRATQPRASLAMELTRDADPLAPPPLLNPRVPPPFTQRLRLIATQLLAYAHMQALSDELETIAHRLATES